MQNWQNFKPRWNFEHLDGRDRLKQRMRIKNQLLALRAGWPHKQVQLTTAYLLWVILKNELGNSPARFLLPEIDGIAPNVVASRVADARELRLLDKHTYRLTAFGLEYLGVYPLGVVAGDPVIYHVKGEDIRARAADPMDNLGGLPLRIGAEDDYRLVTARKFWPVALEGCWRHPRDWLAHALLREYEANTDQCISLIAHEVGYQVHRVQTYRARLEYTARWKAARKAKS